MKETELELKEFLEGHPLLHQIIQNIHQVVWVVDPGSGQILYVSPTFESVWGVPCEIFYADPSTWIQSVHPEDQIQVLSAKLDGSRTSLQQSYRILQPDGSLRSISAQTFLVHDVQAGDRYQICIAQDITEQSQIDRKLRKALDRSREQFTLSRRMSLARGPEAVLNILMSAAKLAGAKHAFAAFFGSREGIPSHELDIIAAWSSERFQSNPDVQESRDQSSLIEELAVLDLFHPSKPVIVTEISRDERLSLPVRDALLERQIQTVATFPLVALGNWLGCLLVFFPQPNFFEALELRHIKVLVDQASITLYNLQLLKKEEESRHEAEQANEIKTRFLAMISHELRTPLTSIKGFTTTLLAEDVTWEPEEQRDFVQTIHQEASRLQELIDHLLDLSRLEAGMLPIALERHSLQEIVLDGLPQFRVMTQKHALSIRLPMDLPPISVDARRVGQVLVNLVQNAATYSPPGTEIILTAEVRGEFLQVNVSDQGPGIPLADRKRVFQAFQRGALEENSAEKGAGLGLAICKGLVEAHGGRIWVRKQSAPGTTISFTIPLVPGLIAHNTQGGVLKGHGKYINRRR
ncbi:MAG TPA: ATP-binding protein [Anaerolineaceae bacterium]|nr:ATP-binding protein [Anaerolineaceae bacterium]